MKLIVVSLVFSLVLSLSSIFSLAAGPTSRSNDTILTDSDYHLLDNEVINKVQIIDDLLKVIRPQSGPGTHIGYWPYQSEQQKLFQLIEELRLHETTRKQKVIADQLALNLLHKLVNIAPLVSPTFYKGDWHLEDDEDISDIRRSVRLLARLTVTCEGILGSIGSKGAP